MDLLDHASNCRPHVGVTLGPEVLAVPLSSDPNLGTYKAIKLNLCINLGIFQRYLRSLAMIIIL